jgi:DOMON domain
MKKNIVFILFAIISILVLAPGIGAMEYKHSLEAKDMNFRWTVDETEIHIEISAKTTGWVGIGFNPEKAMQGANIIIGAVKKGKVKIQDHYGNRQRGHIADTKEGGTDHVKNAMGNEKDGITTLSFTIPLNAGDKFDTEIKADGTDIIMLAYGGGRDNFTGRHPFRAVYSVNLKTGENKKVK